MSSVGLESLEKSDFNDFPWSMIVNVSHDIDW